VGRDAREAERLVEERRRRGIRGEAFAGDVDATAARLEELEAAGAAWAILLPAGPPDRLELIGERLLPRLATRP
jgi:alkanesulfonate monooxygenase SsuD/methylene tetrahydromethanopterin reductase-like flavin-dependent oxidoreductase (luciferase family)